MIFAQSAARDIADLIVPLPNALARYRPQQRYHLIDDPWALARIDAAALGQLDAWLDGLFQAETLETLLRGQSPQSRPPAG